VRGQFGPHGQEQQPGEQQPAAGPAFLGGLPAATPRPASADRSATWPRSRRSRRCLARAPGKTLDTARASGPICRSGWAAYNRRPAPGALANRSPPALGERNATTGPPCRPGTQPRPVAHGHSTPHGHSTRPSAWSTAILASAIRDSAAGDIAAGNSPARNWAIRSRVGRGYPAGVTVSRDRSDPGTSPRAARLCSLPPVCGLPGTGQRVRSHRPAAARGATAGENGGQSRTIATPEQQITGGRRGALVGTKFAGNHAVSSAAVAKGIGRTYDLLTVTALCLTCGKESVRPEASGGHVV